MSFGPSTLPTCRRRRRTGCDTRLYECNEHHKVLNDGGELSGHYDIHILFLFMEHENDINQNK